MGGAGMGGGAMGLPVAMAIGQPVQQLGARSNNSTVNDILRWQAVQSMRDQAARSNRTFEEWVADQRRTQDYQMLMMGVYHPPP